jgi:hypothetical protein
MFFVLNGVVGGANAGRCGILVPVIRDLKSFIIFQEGESFQLLISVCVHIPSFTAASIVAERKEGFIQG